MKQSDLTKVLDKAWNRELLPEKTTELLCSSLKDILANEPNILQIQYPVTVVGDIHGQYYDLIELFKVGGGCPDVNYLFLGDYVDRGSFSVESLTLLISLKLRWPNRIHLLRGNHESKGITEVYGFYAECMRKYGNAKVWNIFVELFNFFPISAVISDTYFCVHGGLSPKLETLDQIAVIDRFKEIPHDGALADIMWSDPNASASGFQPSNRGLGYTFGSDVVDKFLKTNKLNHIVRAHQLCMDGFQSLWDDKFITVWSAPNYCYRCGNVASIMEIADNGSFSFNIFPAAPDSVRQKTELEANKAVPDYFL